MYEKLKVQFLATQQIYVLQIYQKNLSANTQKVNHYQITRPASSVYTISYAYCNCCCVCLQTEKGCTILSREGVQWTFAREWRVVLRIRRGGEGKVPCLTRCLDHSSRRPVVHVRDSADKELRPVLHRLLGPPWAQSALVLRPDGSHANAAAQAITFNKLSDYAILCSNYFYTNIYIQ